MNSTKIVLTVARGIASTRIPERIALAREHGIDPLRVLANSGAGPVKAEGLAPPKQRAHGAKARKLERARACANAHAHAVDALRPLQAELAILRADFAGAASNRARKRIAHKIAAVEARVAALLNAPALEIACPGAAPAVAADPVDTWDRVAVRLRGARAARVLATMRQSDALWRTAAAVARARGLTPRDPIASYLDDLVG